jgi:hypothetical protein
MADLTSGPVTTCQWCSAELPAPDVERCPSCGATLTSATGTEPELPGLTALDPHAMTGARSGVARPRSRILSFLTGDMPPDSGGPLDPSSVAPPSDAVRREMLRLQIDAERADLEAEAIALKSDALAHRGITLAELNAADAPAGDAPAGDAPGADDDAVAVDAPSVPDAPAGDAPGATPGT